MAQQDIRQVETKGSIEQLSEEEGTNQSIGYARADGDIRQVRRGKTTLSVGRSSATGIISVVALVIIVCVVTFLRYYYK